MKKLSLTTWIFIALAAGIGVGYAAYEMNLGVPEATKTFVAAMTPFSDIFIRLIKSIVSLLLFGSLVYGIAGQGEGKSMGRIGVKAIVYFEVVTTLALVVGLFFVNFFQPGAAVDPSALAGATADLKLPEARVTWQGILTHTFTPSLIDSMAKNDVLQIVVFAFLFGFAANAVGAKARPVVEFCESLTEIMFKYTAYVMYVAPLGVFAAIAVTVGKGGIQSLGPLIKLVATLYGALIFFVVVVLGAVVLIFRIPLKPFWQAAKQPFILAFSTASSEAALPMAMKNLERVGCPKHIVSFVLPTGYSLNLDGSTLYLALASVFVAQAAKVELPIGTQIAMMLSLMLTSKGVAAVPRASLVILAGTLGSFGLPLAGIGLILGVDALMDMARTSVNLLGNCLATAVVSKSEGHDLVPMTAQAEAESAA
jgi:proton glutamate symport protein